MQVNLPIVFGPKFRGLLASSLLAFSLVGCGTAREYSFHSYHIPENQKAAYLHELVNSLKLTKEDKLVFALYGNWGYSLTPLDLDRKLDGSCQDVIVRKGRARARRDVAYYNFFSDIFDQYTHIMSKSQNDCGYELYLEQFEQHPSLNDAVHLALVRFKEIAERLEALHFSRLDLIEKYSDVDELILAIDEDIQSLSRAGYALSQSTKHFFKLAKVQLVMQDVASARKQGLSSLKSFSARLEDTKHTQFSTIEEATLATIRALENLQQDINQ